MKYYHALSKKNSFEGWYFKHQNKNKSIAFIPATYTDENNNLLATIQIIVNDEAFRIDFALCEISIEQEQLSIRMGNCFFSDRGVVIDIEEDGLSLHGKIAYGPLMMLDKDIMGPFKYLPNMECKHGIISLFHRCTGTMTLNDEEIVFDEDIGYIEMDYGHSFPKEYSWTHGAWVDEYENAIVAAAATIPYLKINFLGCLACILFEGKQMVLATYFGAKVKELSKEKIIISQHQYRLEIECLKKNPVKLDAPLNGNLTVAIHENIVSKVQYRLFEKDKCILDKVVDNASFE